MRNDDIQSHFSFLISNFLPNIQPYTILIINDKFYI